ncbi:MAG: aldehyde dehydrogenase (NADP(+)) [Cyclobacteriaceae bacterium]|nr:aldehyde dehydrogenase (NADP(+)) [Cyclobacteriaceae bacterium]UYN88060.1 MAG: aldehyde dehydrogenase (NADP(+)) [Cyclobacteriaceae bacterium]
MAFKDASQAEIDVAVRDAFFTFQSFKNLPSTKRAALLRSMAQEIDGLGQELVKTAMEETELPEARIIAERARTTGHLKMFADYIEEGSWVEARIDTAKPDRAPVPKPDLRKMLMPIGPVVVFGAANFPLAYSTAGGDTASALAAGCTVLVKAHPAHAKTSQLVADAIDRATYVNGVPKGVFQHVHGAGFEVGQALVKHPLTKAVGFTGSFAGGKALFDLANQREEPIPVFAEMSSINPVVLLPQSLKKNFADTATKLAASMVTGVGQFCTNPGLVIAIEHDGLQDFINALAEKIVAQHPETMLHDGIAENYAKKLRQALSQKGVSIEAEASGMPGKRQGKAIVASASASTFMSNPLLAEEVFGPFSLLIRCADRNELHTVISKLHGQLTATMIGEESELIEYQSCFRTLQEKAGRVIINGVPTGVEVCPAMQHGGPFPSTTDSRFTSVGTDAIKRFARPVAFQNCPEALLPNELKEKNPQNIWRMYNGEWKK